MLNIQKVKICSLLLTVIITGRHYLIDMREKKKAKIISSKTEVIFMFIDLAEGLRGVNVQ